MATSTRLQLSVRAEDLKNVAGMFKGTSDPYCEITVTGGVNDGRVVGRTETIKNSLSPDWCSVFVVDFWSPGQYTPLTVSIFDDMSSKGGEDKLMGEGNFEVMEVINSPGHEREEALRPSGSVYLHIDESIRGERSGKLDLHLRAIDLHNIESGALGLGCSDPFFEISKKVRDDRSGITRWKPVYRSEHLKNNLNPFWKPLLIDLEALCNCDLEWPLQVSVVDWEKGGRKNRLIGSLETNVSILQSQIATNGNADRERAFEIFAVDKKGQTRGTGRVCVLKCSLAD